MDSSLVRAGSLFPSKLDRQTHRALARLDADTTLTIRQDRAQIERITETTQTGMVAISQMAGVEAVLCGATPHAAGRIQAAAIAGAVQIVGVIHRTGSGV